MNWDKVDIYMDGITAIGAELVDIQAKLNSPETTIEEMRHALNLCIGAIGSVGALATALAADRYDREKNL